MVSSETLIPIFRKKDTVNHQSNRLLKACRTSGLYPKNQLFPTLLTRRITGDSTALGQKAGKQKIQRQE